MMVRAKLWLHREERDAWLVSRTGLGAGVFVPKSQLALEPGHPVPVFAGSSAPRSGAANLFGGPVGPLDVELPDWLAEEKGLIDVKVEGQGDLF